MAKNEIVILDWTNGKSYKKGELVIQSDGIYIYKTSKFILRNAVDYREIVYAEIPFDVIQNIHIMKKGFLKNHIIKLKINKEHFQKLLGEKHSGLFKHIVNLFNKKNTLYFMVYRNTEEEVINFVNILKERINKN